MSASDEWKKVNLDARRIITKHQSCAPIPVGAIAIDLGLKLSVATLGPNISGEIRRVAKSEAPAGFSIRVNKHEVKYRQRFTIAHEIAHFLLHADKIGDYLTDDVLYRSTLSNKFEAEANRLATDILMPTELIDGHLNEIGTSVDPPQKVKILSSIFEVSAIAMSIRLGFPVPS